MKSNQSDLFVTQNYTITIKDGEIKHCVNTKQRQLRAALTGAQKDIYDVSLWNFVNNAPLLVDQITYKPSL